MDLINDVWITCEPLPSEDEKMRFISLLETAGIGIYETDRTGSTGIRSYFIYHISRGGVCYFTRNCDGVSQQITLRNLEIEILRIINNKAWT